VDFETGTPFRRGDQMRSVGHPRRRRRSRGQALVEFSLIIPVFLTVFFSIVEFSFLFTNYISVNYASHDAAQLAATYGNTQYADAAILQRIDNDISTPADPKKIVTVDIYWVDTTQKDARPVSGHENIYTYDGGAHDFLMPDTTTHISLPFKTTSIGYLDTDRCNYNLGIGCSVLHQTVDTIGVKITYQYAWVTPFPQFVTGSGSGPTLSSINIMRLEPIL
jgi:Flp pilus assembly protein TadG